MEGEYGVKTSDSYLTMVTINTNLVKPADEPKTYNDLLDPKWKGRIAIPRSPSPWNYFAFAFGEEKAKKFLETLLRKQEVKTLARYPDVRSRVIGGEFAIGFGTDAWAEIAKGAPVKHPDIDNRDPRRPWRLHHKGRQGAEHRQVVGLLGGVSAGQKTIHDVRGYSLVTSKGTYMHNYVQGKKVLDIPFDWRMKNEARLTKVFRAVLREK